MLESESYSTSKETIFRAIDNPPSRETTTIFTALISPYDRNHREIQPTCFSHHLHSRHGSSSILYLSSTDSARLVHLPINSCDPPTVLNSARLVTIPSQDWIKLAFSSHHQPIVTTATTSPSFAFGSFHLQPTIFPRPNEEPQTLLHLWCRVAVG